MIELLRSQNLCHVKITLIHHILHFLLFDDKGELTERGKLIIAHTPMGKFGEPEELIGALIYLSSDASKFVTGVVLPIDGGFSAFSGV